MKLAKEYKMEGKPILCERGFHYCDHPPEVLEFYNFLSCFRLLEIEDLSNETCEEYMSGSKFCSNHIKIIREIVGEELLSLLCVDVINDCDSVKTYKPKHSCLEVSWNLESNIDTIDIIKAGSTCYTDTYYYDKNRNLKTLITHYGRRYDFTKQGFVL